MVKERLLWMLGGAIITVVVFILAQQFVFGSTSAEQITQEEAEVIVKNNFSGDIDGIEDNGGYYTVRINLESGTYVVIVDKTSGELTEIEQVDKPEGSKANEPEVDEREQPDTNDEQNNIEEDDKDQEDSEPDQQTKDDNNQSEDLLSEKEVIDQVQSEYKGKINSIKMVEEESPYFKIEVESDLQEIKLDIDALTGEILKEDVENKEKQTPISENEAIKKAIKLVEGEVDDIELKELNGTFYYFIEIESSLDQDAKIKVNAIDGKATIIWGED